MVMKMKIAPMVNMTMTTHQMNQGVDGSGIWSPTN